jgi:hypothetical protein
LMKMWGYVNDITIDAFLVELFLSNSMKDTGKRFLKGTHARDFIVHFSHYFGIIKW